MNNRRKFLASIAVTGTGLVFGCKKQPVADPVLPYRNDLKCQDLIQSVNSHDIIKDFSEEDLLQFHNPLYSIENPLGPAPLALKAIAEVPAVYNRYGVQEHLEGILKKKLAIELEIPVEQVHLKAGSTQTLRMCVESLTSKSKPVLMADHDYGFMHEFVRDYKSRIITTPMTKKMAVDLNALERFAKQAGMVYLSNPHLPFSHVHTRQSIEKLAKKIAPTPLVVDECYIHFLGQDYKKYSCATLVKNHPNIIVTRTFSKAFGLAGLRIGYHAVSPKLASKLDLYCRGMSPLSVAAAIGALEDKEHLEKTRKYTADARAKLISFCQKHQLEYEKNAKTPFFTMYFSDLSPAKVAVFQGSKMGMRKVQYPGPVKHFQMISLVEWKYISEHLKQLEKMLLS